MAWIESHTVLLRHRKLIALADTLKTRRSHAIGYLHALWHDVLEQKDDGDLSQWSNKMIAAAADYGGDATAFVRALKRCGWMEKDGRLHDWWEYSGTFLRGRYRRFPKTWQRIQLMYSSGAAPELLRIPVQTAQQDHRTEPNRPTEPNQPNQTKPTEPESQPIDLRQEIDKLADRKAEALREARLLDLRMPFGDRKGVRVFDLEPDYCRFVLEKCTGIGEELKDALRMRLAIKRRESNAKIRY